MKNTKILLTISLLILLFISGCTSSTTGVQDTLLNGKWVLQTINNKEVVLEKTGGEIPYLDFNVKLYLVTGSTGCNVLRGKIYVNSDEITFSEMSMTKIFCSDAEYEVPITGFLFHSEPLGYKVNNNVLTFTKKDKVVMTFKKQL